jgi:hypothetical protein
MLQYQKVPKSYKNLQSKRGPSTSGVVVMEITTLGVGTRAIRGRTLIRQSLTLDWFDSWRTKLLNNLFEESKFGAFFYQEPLDAIQCTKDSTERCLVSVAIQIQRNDSACGLVSVEFKTSSAVARFYISVCEQLNDLESSTTNGRNHTATE